MRGYQKLGSVGSLHFQDLLGPYRTISCSESALGEIVKTSGSYQRHPVLWPCFTTYQQQECESFSPRGATPRKRKARSLTLRSRYIHNTYLLWGLKYINRPTSSAESPAGQASVLSLISSSASKSLPPLSVKPSARTWLGVVDGTGPLAGSPEGPPEQTRCLSLAVLSAFWCAQRYSSLLLRMAWQQVLIPRHRRDSS